MPSPDTHQLGFRVPKAYTKSLHSGLDTSQAIIIDVKSTSGSSDQRVKLEEPRVVGSYNWLRRREATIAVPGGPPVWQDEVEIGHLTTAVSQDVHKNAAKLSPSRTSPLDPLLRSVAICSPSLPLDTFDVVTDRNNLRKLAYFFHPVTKGTLDTYDEFRINAEVIGNTLLLTRWEPCVSDRMSHMTYSPSYKKLATKQQGEGVNEVESSYAVMEADLDGLKLLMRFEVDAVLDNGSGGTAVQDAAEEELSNLFHELYTDDTSTLTTPESYNIIRTGHLPRLTSLIKLKTRSLKTRYDPSDIHYQAIWSGPTHVYVARHKCGDFSGREVEKIELDKLGQRVSGWEEMASRVRGSVAGLLREIRRAILEGVGEEVEVAVVREREREVERGGPVLMLYVMMEEERNLSRVGEDVRDRFRNRHEDDSGEAEALEEEEQDGYDCEQNEKVQDGTSEDENTDGTSVEQGGL